MRTPAALEGIRVIDCSTWLAGPYCSMQLADMGADVIRIDPPGGAIDRTVGPFTRHGRSIEYDICVQRNKRNITLDFTCAAGWQVLGKLIGKSDVVVHNFPPGTRQAEILGYDRLKELKTDIVVARISGFGQNGPCATRVAFDATAQAESGAMALTGFSGQPPTRSQVNYVDFGTGLHAALGIMYALYSRRQTGEGQEIDVALFDVGVSFVATIGAIAENQLNGTVRPQLGNHGYMAFGDAYRTRDGWVIINVGTEAQWQRFVHVVGKDEWASDPRFKTNADRFYHREVYTGVHQLWMSQRTTQEVIRAMAEARIPCGAINPISRVASHPQARARNILVEMDYPDEGTVLVPGIVPRLSKTPGGIYRQSPTLGENNHEVFCDLLGLPEEEYEELKTRQVI